MNALALSRQLPQTFWRNRSLLLQLCVRDVVERYRGSAGGLVWSLVNPLMMLAIYSFVFGVVFQSRWSGGVSISRVDFTLLLFTGLITFGIFNEIANRSPQLILSKPGFVKKVVFPLELLPFVAIGNALFHFAAALAILLLFCLFAYGSIQWTIALIPVVLLPLLVLSLGVSWLLSSIGVFMHDLRHAVPFVTTALMFLTPIFYPTVAVPEQFRFLMVANPLTASVENMRLVVLAGQLPNWGELLLSLVVNSVFALVCLLWFQRARRFFADVV